MPAKQQRMCNLLALEPVKSEWLSSFTRTWGWSAVWHELHLTDEC